MHRYRLVTCLLLPALLILAGFLSSCDEKPPEEIVPAVLSAYDKVATYSYESFCSAERTITENNQSSTSTANTSHYGRVNIEDRQYTADYTRTDNALYALNLHALHYMTDDWLYIKSEILQGDSQPDYDGWTKMDRHDEQQNKDDRYWTGRNELGKLIGLLDSAREVTVKGTETLDGMKTRILDIEPDWNEFIAWLYDQPPWEAARFYDFPDKLESLSFRLWVTEDTNQIVKCRVTANYELVSFSESVTRINYHSQFRFSDYNEPFDMVLPEETKGAKLGPIS